MSVPAEGRSRSQTAFEETSASTLPRTDASVATRPQSSAYADALAAALVEMDRAGLRLVPTGGHDGKKPQVNGWQARPLRPDDPRWRERFATANVGVVCGASGLVVVDIDYPSAVDEILERYGPTRLKVRTPRGGLHLYYRSHGAVGSSKIRSRDGRTVGDIKAGNAMVIAPPSVRPGAGAYTFEDGSWSDIARLPLFPVEEIQPRGQGVQEGRRNDAIFDYALSQAAWCDSPEDLVDVVTTWAEATCEGQLPASEIEKTCQSAWRYQTEGQNFHATKGANMVRGVDVERLTSHTNGADAALLWLMLLQAHQARVARGETFAIVADKMVATAPMAWTEWRIRKARDALLEMGFIRRVRSGGNGPGDAHQYTLASPALRCGNLPPMKQTPSPLGAGRQRQGQRKKSRVLPNGRNET